MGLVDRLIKSAFLGLALAAWQLFLQPLYNRWIESQGRAVGFGETALGYTVVILATWTVASLVTRRLSSDKD